MDSKKCAAPDIIYLTRLVSSLLRKIRLGVEGGKEMRGLTNHLPTELGVLLERMAFQRW